MKVNGGLTNNMVMAKRLGQTNLPIKAISSMARSMDKVTFNGLMVPTLQGSVSTIAFMAEAFTPGMTAVGTMDFGETTKSMAREFSHGPINVVMQETMQTTRSKAGENYIGQMVDLTEATGTKVNKTEEALS